MKSFPKGTKFRFKWRPYQARILSELEEYLEDKHLHVVAAPGSGKTVLGLEVVRRLNKPSLVLAPTLAIRDQWIKRLVDFFLPYSDGRPDWISTDIRNPKFFTVSTYQGLHSAYTGIEQRIAEEEENDDEDDEEHSLSQNSVGIDFVPLLEKVGVSTIVIDEAHHLRSAWWNSLVSVIDRLGDVTTLALTATPPYDVSITEWERYLALCGPVDAEVAVPELVQQKNLCPHQDLVLLTAPSFAENKDVKKFRDDIEIFKNEILDDLEFRKILLRHPWIKKPTKFIDEILENPGYFSSMLIFLKKTGYEIPKETLALVVESSDWLPRFNLEWLEILLENALYPPDVSRKDTPRVLLEIRKRLSRIDALERRRVKLRSAKKLDNTLKRSISKLQAISAISMLEHKALKEKLRMVILTDYIRKAYLPSAADDTIKMDKLGVVPIFETLRKLGIKECTLGVLSGSLVIIPKCSTLLLYKSAKVCEIDQSDITLKDLAHDDRYVTVKLSGTSRQRMVQLITEIFGKGGIEILVGTKSLLGEGWDAPSINTLVLASFVGSYMLSNQMRGRAIRVEQGNPDKTSNIWHLVCVETDSEIAGNDYNTMIRRFKAFVGISFVGTYIENGFARLGIDKPPFSNESIRTINGEMSVIAQDRDTLNQRWEIALQRGDEYVRLVEDVKAKRVHLPRGFVFTNTMTTLTWQLVFILGAYLARQIPGLIVPLNNPTLEILSYLPLLGFILFILKFLPKFVKAITLFIRHGPVKSSMKQIGKALLHTLSHSGIVKTDLTQMRVIVEEEERGTIFCHIEGGTKRETGIYLNALKEILGPIDNPRYMLVRKSKFGGRIVRRDYHSVPSIIGVKKKYALHFAEMWRKHVGEMEIIYTRNREGRIALLKARNHSLSAGFRPRAERISQWK